MSSIALVSPDFHNYADTEIALDADVAKGSATSVEPVEFVHVSMMLLEKKLRACGVLIAPWANALILSL